MKNTILLTQFFTAFKQVINIKLYLKFSIFLILGLLLSSQLAQAQADDIYIGQNEDVYEDESYLSLGTKNVGIAFGHSKIYSGLRFNLWDKKGYVQKVNCLNFGLGRINARKSNGLAIGILINADSTNNGLSFGLVNRGKNRNGLAIGGFTSYFSDTANGVIIAGLHSGARVMNGLGLGMMSTEAIVFNGIGIGGSAVGAYKFNGIGIAIMGGVVGDTLNGLFLGLDISKFPFEKRIHQLNGLGIAYILTVVNETNGVVLSPINLSKEQNGVSVGVFNRTEKLRGFQFGLINYAGNNHRLLRWLPIINMHLGK